MRRHRHKLSPEQSAKLVQYLATHPAMQPIYCFKQKLCYLLLEKHQNHRRCRQLAPKLLRLIAELKEAIFAPLVKLGHTLDSWKEEIATMWRFTRNNGITEGFHTKMEVLARQAYGFCNFNNYKLRVKVLCS
jgi:transposase